MCLEMFKQIKKDIGNCQCLKAAIGQEARSLQEVGYIWALLLYVLILSIWFVILNMFEWCVGRTIREQWVTQNPSDLTAWTFAHWSSSQERAKVKAAHDARCSLIAQEIHELLLNAGGDTIEQAGLWDKSSWKECG